MSWYTLRALAVWSLGCLLPFPQLSMGQYRSLYSDPKASRIGDALTVIIQENATATNQTATATGKSNSTSIGSAVPGGGNLLDFIPITHLTATTATIIRDRLLPRAAPA